MALQRFLSSCKHSQVLKAAFRSKAGLSAICTYQQRAGYSTLYKRSLLMTQFEKIKSQYPNYVLLFQVGDFYELYGNDASEVSSKTSLRLTKKGNVFMAGFPVKALGEWQRMLVEAGFQLAICDQTTPKEGEKVRLLGREVVKLVTPGTLLEPLTNHANYLLCINPGPSSMVALAWLDISTADFQMTSSEVQSIEEDIERICPSEVLLPEDVSMAIEHGKVPHPSPSPSLDGLVKSSLLRECHVTSVPMQWYAEPCHDNQELSKFLQGQAFSDLEATAVSVLLQFVTHTQRSVVPLLSPPSRYTHQNHMAIDSNTRRALELVTSVVLAYKLETLGLLCPLHSNTKKTTLLGCIDKTVTAAGGRLLKARLASPQTNILEINRRLDAVELFSKEIFHCEVIVDMLKKCEDLERILQKVATNSANITDLQAIKTTLTISEEIRAYIVDNLADWSALEPDMEGLDDHSELVNELDKALSGGTYGDYITTGYSDQIDTLRADLRHNEEQLASLIESLQTKFPNLPRLTISSHKGYIRVFEVTKTRAVKIDKCPDLIRVDATQSKVRYSNLELQSLNAKLQLLESQYSTAQSQLFNTLCEQVVSEGEGIKRTAHVLARLDVASSLGALAKERAYCRPTIVEEPVFKVKGATHPVVSSTQLGTFVSNDCDMSQHRLWVVTGPNMGGKSTFLRQNALLAILAQMGSLVPAEGVVMGVVDRLFARVGATDNVAKHMSTFHMEMSETATILRNATSQSFVILDEIGRGTGTTEGLVIAQAVVEHLRDSIGSRTLVATHFHQLASLADSYQNVGCYKLVADSNEHGIMFTYKIKPGHVEQSFAIEVAKLAGVPQSVVDRAKELLLVSSE